MTTELVGKELSIGNNPNKVNFFTPKFSAPPVKSAERGGGGGLQDILYCQTCLNTQARSFHQTSNRYKENIYDTCSTEENYGD